MRNPSMPDPLLITVATVLGERADNMQHAINRLAEIAMQRGKPAPEAIVAFQAFDRITQEFDALSEMLRGYASATDGNRELCAQRIVAAVPLSDLKSRLVEKVQMLKDDVLAIGANSEDGYKVF